ncbi:MAG: NADH-quinone oxidoreductase subunit J [Bacteroidota bacterium]|nr:NADH-quinone oxidoreductase subunit J [Bacteroidota bacterium]
MNFEVVFFFSIAALAIVSAILMITQRNPIKSVIFLIVNFFCIALIYLILHAQFIAIIQILVYAGAIMVLFLFIIMLLNLGDESALTEKIGYKKTIAYVLSAVLLLEIVIGLSLPWTVAASRIHPNANEIGTVEAIGKSLFIDYLLPFEVISMLLLAAIVGVIVLAKKKFQ